MKYQQIVILVIIILIVMILISLGIVKIIDQRLENIAINVPEPSKPKVKIYIRKSDLQNMCKYSGKLRGIYNEYTCVDYPPKKMRQLSGLDDHADTYCDYRLDFGKKIIDPSLTKNDNYISHPSNFID